MPPIINPGWLLLVFCGFMLLLIGCSMIASRTPVPLATSLPDVTLTVIDLATDLPQALKTPPPATAERSSTLQNNNRQMTTLSPPGQIMVENPTCYNTPNDGYVCLGQVHNPTQGPISDVQLRVRLLNNQGDVRAATSIVLEQQIIPAHASAPYRAIFDSIADNTVRAEAQIEAFRNLTQALPTIAIIEQQGTLTVAGTFIVTARLLNTSGQTMKQLRLIVTLLDENDRVIGYRVQTLTQALSNQANTRVQIAVIPTVQSDTLRYELHVESADAIADRQASPTARFN